MNTSKTFKFTSFNYYICFTSEINVIKKSCFFLLITCIFLPKLNLKNCFFFKRSLKISSPLKIVHPFPSPPFLTWYWIQSARHTIISKPFLQRHVPFTTFLCRTYRSLLKFSTVTRLRHVKDLLKIVSTKCLPKVIDNFI